MSPASPPAQSHGPPETWALSACTAPFEKAWTLPGVCYTSPSFYAREVETIFRRDWLCVGRIDQVEMPGDYFCVDIIDEPVVVLRDDDGVLRVLSRVCRHRAMPVLCGSGNTRTIICPYHRWSYGLDGRLVGAPEMSATPGFDDAQIGLPEIRHEVWHGFIMINFDPNAPPFAPPLDNLSRRIANWRLGDMRSVASFEFDYPWNWKVMIDNYIECYHHPTVHRHSLEPAMPARATYFEPDDGPYSILQIPYRAGYGPAAPSRSGDGPKLAVIGTLSEAERRRASLLQILPTLLFALYPNRMDYYCLFPEGPARLRLRKTFCVAPEQIEAPDFEAGLKHVTDTYIAYAPEDRDVCRGLQRGLYSRLSAPSRYCHMEEGGWRFAKYVAERVIGRQ